MFRSTLVFELVENRLYAYADDSSLLAVVCKPAETPAVAALINRYFARIQEWCNYWCMILNPNKTKGLVVSRSRTWCEGGRRQQRNDGEGCVTMRERSERVESPGTYVTE